MGRHASRDPVLLPMSSATLLSSSYAIICAYMKHIVVKPRQTGELNLRQKCMFWLNHLIVWKCTGTCFEHAYSDLVTYTYSASGIRAKIEGSKLLLLAYSIKTGDFVPKRVYIWLQFSQTDLKSLKLSINKRHCYYLFIYTPFCWILAK